MMSKRPTAKITMYGDTKSIDLADFYALVCYALRGLLNENAEHQLLDWKDENERDAVYAEDKRMILLGRDLRDRCLHVVGLTERTNR